MISGAIGISEDWFAWLGFMTYQPLRVIQWQILFTHFGKLFGLVGFYSISKIVGYLMPNTLYTYIINIYDLVWLGFMAYQSL